jgi:hypothetical protein
LPKKAKEQLLCNSHYREGCIRIAEFLGYCTKREEIFIEGEREFLLLRHFFPKDTTPVSMVEYLQYHESENPVEGQLAVF